MPSCSAMSLDRQLIRPETPGHARAAPWDGSAAFLSRSAAAGPQPAKWRRPVEVRASAGKCLSRRRTAIRLLPPAGSMEALRTLLEGARPVARRSW